MKYHIGRSQSYCIILLPRNRILFSWDGECTDFFYFFLFILSRSTAELQHLPWNLSLISLDFLTTGVLHFVRLRVFLKFALAWERTRVG
jgi:hypothetical protein